MWCLRLQLLQRSVLAALFLFLLLLLHIHLSGKSSHKIPVQFERANATPVASSGTDVFSFPSIMKRCGVDEGFYLGSVAKYADCLQWLQTQVPERYTAQKPRCPPIGTGTILYYHTSWFPNNENDLQLPDMYKLSLMSLAVTQSDNAKVYLWIPDEISAESVQKLVEYFMPSCKIVVSNFRLQKASMSEQWAGDKNDALHKALNTLGNVHNKVMASDGDEQNQIMETNVWLKYQWKDYKLRWNPKNYGGVADVRFHKGSIWCPDVLLYNSVDPSFDSTYPSNLVVYSTGEVNWIPPGILKSSCKIDITWFPFDDQTCYLKFGSWTYNGFALDLQPARPVTGIDTSEYLESGEFIILSTPVKRFERFYECCPEPYPDLKFYLNIRRKTLYYGVNLILPSMLMVFMTIVGFTLPPQACEKITLEITILLSVSFFQSIVAKITPPTSEVVPLLECIDPALKGLMMHMQQIHLELKFITGRMGRHDKQSDSESDWKFAAMVIDRLCLYVFSVFIVVTTCGIMFSAPHLVA